MALRMRLVMGKGSKEGVLKKVVECNSSRRRRLKWQKTEVEVGMAVIKMRSV